MSTREKLLAGKSFKQDGLDVGRRVFYTLVGEQDPQREMLQTDRNSKAVALLVKALRLNGLLTDTQVDSILLDVVSGGR